jgi:hypothetical protein
LTILPPVGAADLGLKKAFLPPAPTPTIPSNPSKPFLGLFSTGFSFREYRN